MGNLPQIGQPAIIPVCLSIPDYLRDHHFQGQPVLPAVEAMEILARTLKETGLDVPTDHMADICFDRFVPLNPSSDRLDALVELCPLENQGCQAALLTRTKAPKAAITRTKVHARLTIRRSGSPMSPWPLDMAAAPEGICLSVAPEKIYQELVPFGPAYRNIVSPVHVSTDGAIARIKTPPEKDRSGNTKILGSPYALDAAMHAACVWAQHFTGVVAFPVAIDARTIVKPVQAESIYYGRIKPDRVSSDLLIFDIAVLDEHGGLCELSRGVHMRDVSAGRLKPPKWIMRNDEPDPLARLRKKSVALTIIESDAVAPFATDVLTPDEKKRFEKQGFMRQKSFLAGRLALKRLYRHCAHGPGLSATHGPDSSQSDSLLPCCPGAELETDAAGLHCSLSHNRRFAVAVAGSTPVGVDVERISEKLLKSSHIYMHAAERQQVRDSALGSNAAALRVWSIKEAAAKTFSMDLADAWQKVRVTVIGRDSSRLQMAGMDLEACHAQVDEHLVSMVIHP